MVDYQQQLAQTSGERPLGRAGLLMLPREITRFFLQKAKANPCRPPRGKPVEFPEMEKGHGCTPGGCCGAHLPSPEDLVVSSYLDLQGKCVMALKLRLDHVATVGVLGHSPSVTQH